MATTPPVCSPVVEHDDVPADDDEPVAGWLHPDDRLWRHPSEVAHPAWAPPAAARPPGLDSRVWVVAVLGGLIGSLLTTGLITASGGFDRREVPSRSVERVASQAPVLRVAAPTTNVEIADRVRPTIAKLTVDADEGQGSGSGVILRDDGHILTNNHVVEGARAITVELADGKEYKARLVGGDPDSDVAVVKIEGRFPPALLGTAEGLKVGQAALAIGSPLGLAGGPSLSVGVISAIGREVPSRDGPPLYDMIQTDAPIAPGSSGGALVDASGAVIGITTAIAVDPTVGAEGLGFATPIDIARDVAEQLITTGEVVHVWLGIEGTDIDDATSETLAIRGGVLIRSVRRGSPADDAGVRERDVIVAIDDQKITSMGALVVALRTRRPGDTVDVSLVRDGKATTVRAVLAERPKLR